MAGQAVSAKCTGWGAEGFSCERAPLEPRSARAGKACAIRGHQTPIPSSQSHRMVEKVVPNEMRARCELTARTIGCIHEQDDSVAGRRRGTVGPARQHHARDVLGPIFGVFSAQLL